MRYLLYGVIGLIALVIGAVAIGPAFVDWNSYKDTISAEVFDATGRNLEIKGDLALSILPSPRLSASDVRLTGRPGSGRADMAQLGALRVHVRLVPLLGGEVEVTSLTLVDPVLVYEVRGDGTSNWDPVDGALGKPDSAPRADAPQTPADTARGGRSVRFDQLRVENGAIIYRDLAGGAERKLEKISADIAAASLNGPFSLSGDMTSAETPLAFEAKIGSLAVGRVTPIDLTISADDGSDAKIGFKGRLSEFPAAPRLAGALSATSSDLAKIAAAIAGSGKEDARFAVWREQPFELKSRLDATAETIAFNDVSVNLGGTRATGGVNLGLGAKRQIDIALSARQLDLDKLTKVFTPPAPTGTAEARRPATAAAPGAAKSSGWAAPPKDLGGSVNIAVESLTLMGRQIRGLKLAAVLSEGVVTVNQAAARFPGGAAAAVSGNLSSKGGRPAFDGKVEARARSLRETLDWLKVDVSQVARDRLRKFQITAKVRTDPTQVRATEIDMKLDATRVKGGVTYALRDRPSFGASIALDQLNLDAYLPATPAAEKAGSANAAAKPKGKKAAASSPSSFLNGFDANLVLNAGSLTYRQTPIQGLRLNGTLLAGKMTIKEAAVRSVGGARLGIKGTVTNFAGFPAFKGTFDADAKNPAGLFRVLGVKPIQGAGKLGRLKLAGKADTDEKRIIIDTKLGVTGGELTIAGSVADYRDKPTLDLTLNANHPDIRRLAAAFGTELPAGKNGSGRFQMTAKVNGPPDALSLKTDIKAYGGSASLSGRVKSPAEARDIDLNVGFKHPDFIALMRTVMPDYRPSARKVGAFSMASRVVAKAEKLTLEKLTAKIGPTDLSGGAEIDLAGGRPSLTADLTASDLILDPLLPPDEPEGGKPGSRPKAGAQKSEPAAARSGRFSREPLDVAFLDALDAKITFAAKSVTRRKTRVDQPRVEAVLKDRVLTLTKAEGKVFNGTLGVTGALSGAGVPTLTGKVTVRQASVKKALFETADFDLASGTMDLDLDVKGAGRSEHDLIANLNGLMKIATKDGVFKGFDLPAVSQRLKNINRATDILTLFAAGMGGGSTKFSRLDGTFQIVNGVARTNDTKMIAEAGEGTAVGTLDLPKWVMNMDTSFRLSEHPKAPPFGMRLRGPIDEPRRFFQFQDLQAFLLRRSVDRFLKKVLPGEKAPAAQTPPAASPPAAQPPAASNTAPPPPPSPKPKRADEKINPEEILRGLLQGLQNR